MKVHQKNYGEIYRKGKEKLRYEGWKANENSNMLKVFARFPEGLFNKSTTSRSRCYVVEEQLMLLGCCLLHLSLYKYLHICVGCG